MGWSSIFAAVVVLSGVQLMALSMIGEYIARIYVQAQARPLFNIAERLNFGPEQRPDELQRHSLEPPAPESTRVATPLSRPPISNRPVSNRPPEAEVIATEEPT
jgi:hypothetical protein